MIGFRLMGLMLALPVAAYAQVLEPEVRVLVGGSYHAFEERLPASPMVAVAVSTEAGRTGVVGLRWTLEPAWIGLSQGRECLPIVPCDTGPFWDPHLQVSGKLDLVWRAGEVEPYVSYMVSRVFYPGSHQWEHGPGLGLRLPTVPWFVPDAFEFRVRDDARYTIVDWRTWELVAGFGVG